MTPLQQMHSARVGKGFVVFFTGLPGAGKSTTANALGAKLSKTCERPVVLLDGDDLRKHISSDLGFSKEDRDQNVRRLGSMALETINSGVIAVCALIAPYDRLRKEVRELIERAGGGFLLVHVATPLNVCETRDRKGLYARARAGDLTRFTGVSDPYEVPSDAELTIDMTDIAPETAVEQITCCLQRQGYIALTRELRITGQTRLARTDVLNSTAARG